MNTDLFRPRRVRIVEPGLVGSTGFIGYTEFKDGVSVAPVTWREAQLLGSSFRIEDADEPGYLISPVAETERTRERPADDPVCKLVDEGKHMVGETQVRHTREQLEEIADKKGLSGVRDIARIWGRTGRSIVECVNAVLDAQEEADRRAAGGFLESGSKE